MYRGKNKEQHVIIRQYNFFLVLLGNGYINFTGNLLLSLDTRLVVRLIVVDFFFQRFNRMLNGVHILFNWFLEVMHTVQY